MEKYPSMRAGGGGALFLYDLLMIGFENFKILSWNVRGAKSDTGRCFLKELIRKKQP